MGRELPRAWVELPRVGMAEPVRLVWEESWLRAWLVLGAMERPSAERLELLHGARRQAAYLQDGAQAWDLQAPPEKRWVIPHRKNRRIYCPPESPCGSSNTLLESRLVDVLVV